jgi:hypothetical protein
MALNAYIGATQRLLHDTAGQRYSTIDLTTYINSARSQLALEGECVRFLYGLDGMYTLTGTFASGSPTITGVSSTTGLQTGWGLYGNYVANNATIVSTGANTVTMSANATGTGSASFGTQIQTVANQEIYPLPTNVAPLQGILNVIQVRTIAVNFGGSQGSNQYMLEQTDFSELQAYYRFYGPNLVGNPAKWARYNNNIYLRPIPSQPYPMQWDTICSVIDLVDDTTVEALKYPFTDAVPYYAAYLALMNSQRAQDADNMFKLYEQFARRARTFFQRTMMPSLYR